MEEFELKKPNSKPVGISVVLHGANVTDEIVSFKEMKLAAKASIMREDNNLDHFETGVDEKGASNPRWNAYGDLVTPSPLKTDYLALEVIHQGTFLGKRSVGLAMVSLGLLSAGEGIGREIGYPLIRSGKNVGQIVMSHEIRDVEDLPSADGETNPPPQAAIGNPLIRSGKNVGQIVMSHEIRDVEGLVSADGEITNPPPQAAIGNPLIRSGKNVGKIVMSHGIRDVEGLVSADGETSGNPRRRGFFGALTEKIGSLIEE